MGMSRSRARRRGAVTWRTVLGLVLIPLTAAGVLLWGLWNPTDHLDRVTAAIVNLDEGATVGGQFVPLGRVLAAELIGEAPAADDAAENFTWVLTDEADADRGLTDGEYAAVVTIPEQFSSAATSSARGADDAETARIEVETSERGRLLDTALSNIVIGAATSVLNHQLGSQFVGGVFVGMAELGAGLDTAASGADELAAGLDPIATGIDGVSTGARELASGAGQLASGLSEASGGASDLAAGARAAAAGGADLAAGITQYTGGVNQVLGGLQAYSPQLITQMEAVRDGLLDGSITPPAGVTVADAVAQLDALITALNGIGGMIGAGDSLAAGAQASAAGQAQLATGAEDLAAGLQQLAAGAPALADGASQLADGTDQLADGTRQASDGAAELADGLDEAAVGIPRYTAAESERLAESMTRPVELDGAGDAAGDELFNSSGVPLFSSIALWAGGLAVFLVLPPLWRRTRDAARGIAYLTMRSALPAFAIGAGQGALLGLLLPSILGYSLLQGLGFFVLALIGGMSFALMNQGLAALFGRVGRFVSFALLALALAVGVVSTAPALLQSIDAAGPIGALFLGLQPIASGSAGGGAAVFALVLWGLGGLALTAFAVSRARRRG